MNEIDKAAKWLDEQLREYGGVSPQDEVNHRVLLILGALAVSQREAEQMRKGLHAVLDLIEGSRGVDGLHLNGDIAPWDSLRTGGNYEGWLRDFDAALAGGSNA